jgi:hypothetical protein
MKSWFNVSYVKLITCSQFRTPKCPICRAEARKEKLLHLFMNIEINEEEERKILNAEKKIQNLEKQINHLRLVVNTTCIYTTDMEENTLC